MFLNPLMLAGIGGAAVPLVLHLLSRAQHRPVTWGAMMFLTGVEAKQLRGTRMKQWVLLLLRMGTVAALAVALARPALRGRFGALTGNGRATAVIILDNSGSMNYLESGRTRLDQARQAALQILSAMNREDQVSLLVTRTAQTPAERAPTADLQSVAARVAAVRPGAADASFADSLGGAADVLERYERRNREIYIVCDRQAFSWRRVNDAFRRNWQARWGAGAAPRITVIEVGGESADNVLVESLELLNPPIIRDQPAEIEVRLHNYGSIPRGALPLTLRVDGRPLTETTVAIAPDSAATVKLSARFADPGSHVLTAAVRSSGLASDDRFDRAIDVSEPVRVLIVSGDEPTEEVTIGASYQDAGPLLRLALAPNATARRQGADPATVDIAAITDWPALHPLDKYDVLILANVERLTPAQARDVEQYVYGGGGLLIAPSSLSRVDEYDNILYRFGAGIMPASLAPATAVDGSSATSLQILAADHAIFRFLEGKADALPPAVIKRYFPATPRTSDARVLAAYASGAPALVEGGAGRGRVLLLTTGLDARWTGLPSSSFYLPFVQSMVRHLSRAAGTNRNLTSGQPLVALLAEPVEERSVTLRLPSGQTEPLAATRFEARTEIRFTRTEEPGTYRLRYRSSGRDRTLHYVVAAPRAESDLAPMSDQRWRRLSQEMRIERIDPSQTPVAAAVARDRTGRELWTVMLAAVVGLLGAEMLLARLWSSDPG